jgi:hypothetical protein
MLIVYLPGNSMLLYGVPHATVRHLAQSSLNFLHDTIVGLLLKPDQHKYQFQVILVIHGTIWISLVR